ALVGRAAQHAAEADVPAELLDRFGVIHVHTQHGEDLAHCLIGGLLGQLLLAQPAQFLVGRFGHRSSPSDKRKPASPAAGGRVRREGAPPTRAWLADSTARRWRWRR